MSLAEHIVVPERRCAIGRLLETIDDADDRATLAGWMDADYPSAPAIVHALAAEGYGDVGTSTLRTHRRKQCPCYGRTS